MENTNGRKKENRYTSTISVSFATSFDSNWNKAWARVHPFILWLIFRNFWHGVWQYNCWTADDKRTYQILHGARSRCRQGTAAPLVLWSILPHKGCGFWCHRRDCHKFGTKETKRGENCCLSVGLKCVMSAKGGSPPGTQCCGRCGTLSPGPGTWFGCKRPSRWCIWWTACTRPGSKGTESNSSHSNTVERDSRSFLFHNDDSNQPLNLKQQEWWNHLGQVCSARCPILPPSVPTG